MAKLKGRFLSWAVHLDYPLSDFNPIRRIDAEISKRKRILASKNPIGPTIRRNVTENYCGVQVEPRLQCGLDD
jgi:hypothetical protein